jgi:hypothetical protein
MVSAAAAVISFGSGEGTTHSIIMPPSRLQPKLELTLRRWRKEREGTDEI